MRYWLNPGYFTIDAAGTFHTVPDDVIAKCDACGYIFHARDGACPRCGLECDAQGRALPVAA